MATKKKTDTAATEPDMSAVPENVGAWADEAVTKLKEEGARRANPDIHFHKFQLPNGQMNPIAGIVLDKRERKGGDGGWYFILGLTRPTVLFDGEKNAVEGKPGMFAWVDEKWCIASLGDHLPKTDGTAMNNIMAVTEAIIVPTGKRGLAGGHSVWEAEVYLVNKEPTAEMPIIAPKANRPAAALGAGTPDKDETDIPF